LQDKGTRRRRYNCELYKLFNEPDITKCIRINRLSWAGHITCMDNSGPLNKVFHTRSEGTRKIGRPKLWWEKGVIQDIKALGVNWRSVADTSEHQGPHRTVKPIKMILMLGSKQCNPNM
jgi:hypothetical protein